MGGSFNTREYFHGKRNIGIYSPVKILLDYGYDVLTVDGDIFEL